MAERWIFNRYMASGFSPEEEARLKAKGVELPPPVDNIGNNGEVYVRDANGEGELGTRVAIVHATLDYKRGQGHKLDDPERDRRARLIAAAPELLAAAEKVLAGLNARIDAAPGNAKPLFDGIADLHDAIGHAGGKQ